MFIAQYYNSIDTMPIYNYLQVVEHGNYKALVRKSGIFKRNFVTAFENLQRQLVARFGIAESYQEILELRREIILLELEVAITGDRFHNTFIRPKKKELETLLQKKSSSTDEIKDYLEKYKGFHLSLHQITVAEWFGYIKNYSNHVKINKA